MTSSRRSDLLAWFLLAALPLGGGCAGPGHGSQADGADEKDEEDEGDDDVAAKTRELEVARLELDLARLETEQELSAAEQALGEAKVELEKARLEREGFTIDGRALELDDDKLDLDRALGRAQDAEEELKELEAMYSEEEFAERTKELVLLRSRRELEHARRAVELVRRKLTQLETFGLPGKERELEQGWLSAQKGALEAEQALAKLRLEKKIAVTKAEHEVVELEKKLAKLEAKKAKKAKAGA